MLAPVVAGRADFVTGSRRLGREETSDPIRRAGVRFFALLEWKTVNLSRKVPRLATSQTRSTQSTCFTPVSRSHPAER